MYIFLHLLTWLSDLLNDALLYLLKYTKHEYKFLTTNAS